ncbi:MAG: cysteine--tRNA ligase [Ignavibacteriae bacterium HGW-Ignavibacteriae-2]|jgi:cysteinyl-tRNA synthetase|nr:MAG: cysteine--tRNA ligase [Ignavibacteriae bacterium HGW-Ignavibacteriae-2]
MKIYNTLTKSKEEFEPVNPPQVTFYMCGPTVYDLFHIGNGRSFVMSDMFRKYLIYKGYNVKFVMNLTDIDDKIIKRSNEINTDAKEFAEKIIKEFFTDIERLKVKKADVYPKATEHINEIIDLIKILQEKDYAYEVDGDVFYNVSKFIGYGKLSGKKIDDLESGARIEINEIKKNPLDFALWKNAKEGEPFWDSPWGKGRPGWHIECSAMSMKHLGETIDIHAGGNDLIFPHHENEIAQSEGANGKQFVRYWMHFGFLNIKDEKMSKSLGNFFTAREVTKKHSPESIRMLFAQTHYRGPLNFSEDLLDSAAKGLEKLNNFYELLISAIEKSDETPKPEVDIEEFRKKFEDALDDDFNTPQGVAIIFDFIKEINKILAENTPINRNFLLDVKSFVDSTAEILGILKTSEDAGSKGIEDQLINLLINLRTKAKADKNFSLADEIRDEMIKLGITLRDSKEGTTYKLN